jgi:hypothetical protein
VTSAVQAVSDKASTLAALATGPAKAVSFEAFTP